MSGETVSTEAPAGIEELAERICSSLDIDSVVMDGFEWETRVENDPNVLVLSRIPNNDEPPRTIRVQVLLDVIEDSAPVTYRRIRTEVTT